MASGAVGVGLKLSFSGRVTTDMTDDVQTLPIPGYVVQ